MDVLEDLQEISAEELLDVVGEGGEIVVGCGEFAQELEAYGFEITNQNQDRSQFFLRSTGEINAECRSGEVLSLSHSVHVSVEIDEEEADFRTGPVVNSLPPPERLLLRDFWISSPESEPTFQRKVENSEPQEVHAFVEFVRAYTRPSKSCSEVQVHLMLKCARFGVENCVRRSDCIGHFVHKLEITASPKESWKSFSTLGPVRPGEISERTLRTQTTQLQVTAGYPLVGQVSGAVASATNDCGNWFGWLPAKFQRPRPDQDDKSVTWTWQLQRWKDGQKFDGDRTWYLSRKLPDLPVANPENFNLNDLAYENDATWMVSESVADDLGNEFEWDIRIRVHTAVARPCLRFRVLGRLVLACRKSEKCAPCEFHS